MIYFIQAGEDGPIKIGTSRHQVASRFASIQAASPVKLFLRATIGGGRSQERVLHRRFANDRLHGEWFRPSAAVLSAMDEAAKAPRGFADAYREPPNLPPIRRPAGDGE